MPLAPVPKLRPRILRNGSVYTLSSGDEALLAMHLRRRFTRAPFDEPVTLDVTVALRRPKHRARELPCVRPDLDNYLKLVLDAGNGILWTDDARVTDIAARKRYADDPHWVISVGSADSPC